MIVGINSYREVMIGSSMQICREERPRQYGSFQTYWKNKYGELTKVLLFLI